MMHNAEKLIGIELTDAQETMAVRGVNGNLDSYEAIRKIDVPLDTEPAIAFHPALPGFHVKRAPAKVKFKFGKNEPAQFKSVDDLAFATVPQLAELIRTKKVSSVELTRMYLSRLKKYGPKLLCVVTLTEDLAMKQAQAADDDLKRGNIVGLCTEFRGARRTCLRRKESRQPGAPNLIAIKSLIMTRQLLSDCAKRARSSWLTFDGRIGPGPEVVWRRDP